MKTVLVLADQLWPGRKKKRGWIRRHRFGTGGPYVSPWAHLYEKKKPRSAKREAREVEWPGTGPEQKRDRSPR